MSYSTFQKEASVYTKWRSNNKLPYLDIDEIDKIIRDKWIDEKRYNELISFINENWDSGNGDEFAKPFSNHLLNNQELIFYKKLWKGILRNRMNVLWNSFDELTDEFSTVTIENIIDIDLTNFNQFYASEPIQRRVSWNRLHTIEGIKFYIAGLELLKDNDEILKQKILLNRIFNLEKPKPKPSIDKRKIDENLFWELINQTRESAIDKFVFLDNLQTTLESFNPKEIKNFDHLLISKSNELNTWQHWALAYIARGGCGDDEFDYFKSWVISKGKGAFESIKNLDEASLLSFFDEDPQLEELLYLAENIYEHKTSDLMPSAKIKSNKLTGKQWNEDELPIIYASLCALFKYE